jgi:3,4-dihydroxy-2-butanone 4-phosphate synthase
MKDDGTMARMPDLEVFAEKHDLKIVHHRRPDRLPHA